MGDGSGGHGLPGEDDEEGLQDAIELMMGQLMSKDLLYEPMADLKARVCAFLSSSSSSTRGFSNADNSSLSLSLSLFKYPEYLQQHGPTLPSEERERYEKQNTLVNQIVAVFDRPNYSDDDAAQKEEVVSLMTRMQECGTPPKVRRSHFCFSLTQSLQAHMSSVIL